MSYLGFYSLFSSISFISSFFGGGGGGGGGEQLDKLFGVLQPFQQYFLHFELFG